MAATVAQNQRAIRHGIEQRTIMRDQHEPAAQLIAQKTLQHVQRGDVQVVAGFIEQHQLRLAHQRARQHQSVLLATRQLTHVEAQLIGAKAQLRQDGGGTMRLFQRRSTGDGVEHRNSGKLNRQKLLDIG